MSKKYRVNEIFHSLQGEGYYTGCPSVFLRFSGCNLACSFCDTDFAAYREMSAAEIVAEMAKYPSRHAVVTGGEPLLQLDEELIAALKDAKFYIQVETNGTCKAPKGIDWLTCSPKGAIALDVQDIDELKVVYTGQSEEVLERYAERYKSKLYLQPCSCRNTSETVAYIMAHPHWHLSLQTHKLAGFQ